MMPLLDVKDVQAGYGDMRVLHGLSLHIGPQESIGLFGPNGHGKTTLLKTISSLVRPTAGSITFDGTDITGRKPPAIVEAGLIHAPQGNTLFGNMRIAETLELAAFSKRASTGAQRRLDDVYALFPRLAERKTQLAKTLSGGERQMLSIGCALMCAPRLLMLDEPTLGLSPRLKEELGAAIGEISKSGVPLIVVEQDIEFLLSLTDRLYLVEHGVVVREIDRASAPDHEEVMRLYFGEGGTH
ncbi:High-affinity branched-chain amino acid transport ATP-binding protein LivF [Mesorhizobium plurifarium]|jgi:branched-chain amino acid transport system ATP-binding protein|uniref:High-affinity branched-chain amino acid transport ATP-binding protein LivF n=1 Tax=Mesorhizobium plurifarium TaxID=69974 RepID=A0A090G150_MESPL|nr:High-affinity branched-chain amino acid transport ATP-binding protein LivF [Mesorhizobium plurifarium]